MMYDYCNNCNSTEHLFRNCPEPITSYGLVCLHYNKPKNVEKSKRRIQKYINNNLKYLMIMRRNSFTYVEFLRAKYDILDVEYIQVLFNHMTIKERESLLHNKFNYLWNTLWNIKKHGITNPKNKSDFYKGIIKFNILQNGFFNKNDNKFYDMNYFINNATKFYKYPEWYFPKGRKNRDEQNIECAKREFIEETNIKENNFELLEETEDYIELHTGTNDVKYRTIFYIAKYNKQTTPMFNHKYKNNFQKQEIGDVKWLSYDDIIKKFRDYETSKINVFNKLHNDILKYVK